MGKGNERSLRRMEKELKDLAGRKKEMVLPEEGHLLQTVSLVREAYRTAGARRKPMGFFSFTVRQIRYAGRYVWAWQCLLLFGILTVFCGFTRNWSGADLDLMMFLYRRIPLLLCGAGVASAWSCVPLLARARRWQMAEVELAGCSAARLRLAQLLISGGSALSVGGLSAFAAWRLWAIGIESLAAYLFLPFLLAGSCILFFVQREKERYFLFRCTAVLLAGFAAFALVWRILSRGAEDFRDYQVSGAYVWILCGGAAGFWVFQIQQIRRKEMAGWSYVSEI